MRVEGRAVVVDAHINVNMQSLTLEQQMAKMRSSAVQLITSIGDEVCAPKPPRRALIELDGLIGSRGIAPAADPNASVGGV